MLRFTGYDISVDGKSRSSCIVWLFRFAAFLVVAAYTSKQIYPIAVDGFQLPDLWILVYNDHWITLSFLYIVCRRGDKIAKFIHNLMKVFILLKFDGSVFKHFKRYCRILVGILWTYVIIFAIAFPMLTEIVVYLDDSAYVFVTSGLKPSDKMWRSILAACHITLMLLSFFYCETFVLFTVLIVKFFDACFQHINLAIKNHGSEFRSNDLKYQQLYRNVVLLIQEFNKLFSPTIMIIVLVKIGQITASCVNLQDTLAMWKSSYDPDGYKAAYFFTVFPISKAVIGMLLLIHEAHNMHNHSVEIFDNLLNRYLHISIDLTSETREMIKNSYVSLMSGITAVLTPPTINASGYFTINYNLVVISLVVTYFAFIADVKQMSE
ncbi:hypothetical protein CHUAL_009868 [Chamberlinius hualienensis]